MKRIAVMIVACMCALLLTMCNNKDNPATSSVAVRMKDAPSIECQKARLEIKGIRIFVNGQWETVPMNDTIIDILQLRDTSALMGILNVSSGTITQVDITFGDADTVRVGGADFLLTMSTTDLILHVNDTITPNSLFTLLIDIKAAESIFDGDNDGIHHHFGFIGSASCGWRRGH